MSSPDSFVASLRDATPQEAADAKAAAGLAPGELAPRKPGQAPLIPGSPKERWPVKVGTDADVAKVKRAVVDTTVEELGALPRPPTWGAPIQQNDPPVALQTTRFSPTETTVWRVKAQIIEFRLEGDGDFHVELKTPNGQINVEIPLPKPPFVPAASPFAADIRTVRRTFIDAFKTSVAQTNFVPVPSDASTPGAPVMLAPMEMVPDQPMAEAPRSVDLALAFDSDQVPPFVMPVTPPRAATVTGVGFFDKAHRQVNNAPNILELHPVLAITIA